jgi:hypothetical protein
VETSAPELRVRTRGVMKWLLDSDPAVRWQVLRDLTDESDEGIAAERARVATEGWGAQLLDLQSPRGQWGADDDEGWMTTVHTLTLLKDFGVDPSNERTRAAIDRVREGLTWVPLGDRPFFDGETEPCLNGKILGAGAYFGVASNGLVDRLLSEQLEDGGWNCEAPVSQRSSFNTTICVLEGLLEYEKARGATAAVTRARTRAQDYLLERRMFRSLRSGQVINSKWTRFTFPCEWRYDVLRGLDYLRSAGVEPDERVAEAVELVRKRRHQNNRWPLNHVHPGLRTSLTMEPGPGRASRWNTLRAMRVLDWSRTDP